MSILNAAHRATECSEVVEHNGIAAEEVDVIGVGATNRIGPKEAVGIDRDERSIAVVAEAPHGQFQRGGKSTGGIIADPT